MHRLLEEWAPITPVAALELLDARFADQYDIILYYDNIVVVETH
jgi:hypothetical protein